MGMRARDLLVADRFLLDRCDQGPRLEDGKAAYLPRRLDRVSRGEGVLRADLELAEAPAAA